MEANRGPFSNPSTKADHGWNEGWQERALEALPHPVIVTDAEGTILFVNRACVERTGYTREQLVGKRPSMLKSGRVIDWTYRFIWQALSSGHSWTGLLENQTPHGDRYVDFASMAPVFGDDGAIRAYIDIKLPISATDYSGPVDYHVITNDLLTGIPNRQTLIGTLKKRLRFSHARPAEPAFYVAILDVSDFGKLNQAIGNEAADEVLSEVASRLKAFAGDRSFISRLGADEFCLIIEIADAPAVCHDQEIKRYCRQLQKILSAPMRLAFGTITTDLAVGVTLAPMFPEDDVSTVLGRANSALKKAKSNRNGVVVESHGDGVQSFERPRNLLAAVLQGLEEGQFEPAIQCIVSRNGEVARGEALVRWPGYARGGLSPMEFLPAVHQLGKMGELTHHMLDRVIVIQQSLFRAGIALPMSLNVGGVEFLSDAFAEYLLQAVSSSGLPPSLFKLELTEDDIIHDFIGARDRMQALRAFGFRHSLDDFGTGRSSLSRVSELPVDELKIDRSLVRGVPENVGQRAICNSIASLASELGLELVIEGIERKQQVCFFDQVEKVHFQGFYFHRPELFGDWAMKRIEGFGRGG